MGHSSISTTMRYYSQVDEGQRVRAVAVIDGLVSKGVEKTDVRVTPKADLAS